MGYYSTIEVDLPVRKGREQAFLRALEAARKADQKAKRWGTFDGIALEEGLIIATEPEGKWYYDRELIAFLAPFVEAGRIRFLGEDGERWGYDFDGKGNVFALEWKEQRSKQPILRSSERRRK